MRRQKMKLMPCRLGGAFPESGQHSGPGKHWDMLRLACQPQGLGGVVFSPHAPVLVGCHGPLATDNSARGNADARSALLTRYFFYLSWANYCHPMHASFGQTLEVHMIGKST
jgi:hypothetical protein